MPNLKYGRKAPSNAPALMLAPLLTGTIPPAPASVDYGKQSGVGWQMLGNDQYGDCVAVTWANQRAVITATLAGHAAYPNMGQVADLYKTQNPGFPAEDNGMDIQTCLAYLAKHGGPDGVKAVAFAKVDYTNEAELRAAHAIFGQVWYGVNVLAANMDEFDSGQPWDYVAGSPNDGGHSITGVGYDQAGYRFVTWAQEVEWTEAFRAHQVEEAWVVIWPEHLGTVQFETGLDVARLAADYQALTGRTFPVQPPAPAPVPSPVPAPVPAPTPVPVPTSGVTVAFTAADVALLDAWAAARHVGSNRRAADAWRRGA